MVDYTGVFMLVFVCLTSCRAQSHPPTNVTAVYVADGTIRLTWEPPTTGRGIQKYYVSVQETAEYVHVSADQRVYQYNNTKPNATYTFKVSTIISGRIQGSSQSSVTTPTAIYRQKGNRIRLMLLKPPGGISTIEFNSRTLFTFNGNVEIVDKNRTETGVTVSVTSTNTVLAISRLKTEHAGYYYTMQASGNIILGGELLVVTDTPTQPTITPPNPSPVLQTSVTLGCLSSSRSKPDNHGLVLTASWKLNGSMVTHDRFSVNGSNLTITPVRFKDKFNVYKCVAYETGQGVSGLSSEESGAFKLIPRYGPQFVTIVGTDGKSPVIRGDVYGPVSCRTDCNPACDMEWRRQGIPFIPSRSDSSNELGLVDSTLPRMKEVTYTCQARVASSSGFTAPSLDKNITVVVYFPANITMLRYRDDVDNQYMRVDSSEVRYTEGSSLELRVDVDSSPDADVTLLRSQTKVAVGTGKYDIKLDNLQCNHTGTYDVRATNFVTQNRSNADPSRRQFELQVSCVPRRYGGVNAVIGVAGKKGQTVVLNVTVIANPTPTIQWSEGLKTPDVTKNNAYMYTIRGKVTVTTWSDLLKYHVNVTNTVPGLLTVPFEIRPEDVPDTPSDFRAADVSYDVIKVMWISGFNGGNAQLFHIETRTTGNEWSPYKLDIEDEGQGKLMAHTLGNLTSSTDYTIRLNVSNKIGLGNSSVIEVRTLEKPSPISAGSDSTVIVVVVVLTLILVATAGIVLVMMRRRNQGGTAKNNVVTANNEYAVASGGDAARKNVVPADNENNEYAVVFKPPKGAAKNTALNTDTENEYAVVTKPSKGQKQNHKHGGSVPRSQPGPSLQEPQPGPSSQEPQPGPSRTVNQDGLIYLDVEFKPQPGGGGRGVIHGADDRTEYTFVDFSKTAPNSS